MQLTQWTLFRRRQKLSSEELSIATLRPCELPAATVAILREPEIGRGCESVATSQPCAAAGRQLK